MHRNKTKNQSNRSDRRHNGTVQDKLEELYYDRWKRQIMNQTK